MELVLTADHEYAIKLAFTTGMDKAVRKIAFDIEAAVKTNITAVKAIDTGAMKASVFVETNTHHGYGKAMTTAKSTATKGGKKKPLDVIPDEIAGAHMALVAMGVQYAAWVEYGTVHVAARPFFEPAVRKVLTEVTQIMAAEINKLL